MGGGWGFSRCEAIWRGGACYKKALWNRYSPKKSKQQNTKQNKNEMYVAERGFDPRTSGLWAQHASTAPLCFPCIELVNNSYFTKVTLL